MFKQVLVVLFCCLGVVLSFKHSARQIRMAYPLLARTTGGSVVDPFWPLRQITQPLLDIQRKEMRALSPMPESDVIERDDGSIMIRCDLPGVDPKGQRPLFH